MADQSIRTAVEGISPPEKEKHQFFLDVQPVSIFSIGKNKEEETLFRQNVNC